MTPKFLTLILISLSTSVFAVDRDSKSKGDDPVKGNKHIFIHKADKKMIGGRVEVMNEEGKFITAHQLQQRKVIIDFGNSDDGVYIIRFTKGNLVEEIRYIANKVR